MASEPERLQEAREKRQGRGRLSSIDMLPEEAETDVVWALGQLREDKLPQTVILEEFNERLADRGLGPISKGAWSRYSIRKAVQFRKMDEVQKISGELVQQLGTEGPDQATIMVAEMIKTAAFQLLEDGAVDTKGLMELSRALSGAVGAQKASAEHRRKVEDEKRAEVEKALTRAEEAAAKIASEAGLSSDRIAAIRRGVLGLAG